MNKRFRHLLATTLLILAMLLGASGYAINYYLHSPLNIDGTTVDISLPRGGSLSALVYRLQQRGVLRYPVLLLAYNRLQADGHSVKAGDYVLQRGITPLQLLQKLQLNPYRFLILVLIVFQIKLINIVKQNLLLDKIF